MWPLIGFKEKPQHVMFLFKIYNLYFIMRKHDTNPTEQHSTKYWLVFSKASKLGVKKRLRNCSKLKETKEKWELNATCDPALGPLTYGQCWDSWQNYNGIRGLNGSKVSVLFFWFWWLYCDYVGGCPYFKEIQIQLLGRKGAPCWQIILKRFRENCFFALFLQSSINSEIIST